MGLVASLYLYAAMHLEHDRHHCHGHRSRHRHRHRHSHCHQGHRLVAEVVVVVVITHIILNEDNRLHVRLQAFWPSPN